MQIPYTQELPMLKLFPSPSKNPVCLWLLRINTIVPKPLLCIGLVQTIPVLDSATSLVTENLVHLLEGQALGKGSLNLLYSLSWPLSSDHWLMSISPRLGTFVCSVLRLRGTWYIHPCIICGTGVSIYAGHMRDIYSIVMCSIEYII